MRTAAVPGATLVAVLLAGCATSTKAPVAASGSSAVPSDTPSAAAPAGTGVQAALMRFEQFARRESLGGPVRVSYVLTTSAAAEQHLYKDIPGRGGNGSVIAMLAVGRFSGDWEKVPLGVTPKPGRYLTQVVPLTSEVEYSSGGMGDTDPELAALGTVQPG